MFKIFQKARRKLLDQNDLKKYLKYAGGEIILVVVGILIALAINNANELGKDNALEKKLLYHVKEDLKANVDELTDLEASLKDNQEIIDTLIRTIRKREYTIQVAMRVGLIHRKSYFNNANSGYKMITSGYAAKIKNTELLNGMLEIYETDLENVKTMERGMQNLIDNHLSPLTNTLFRVMPDYKLTVDRGDDNILDFYEPIDYQALKSNHEYLNILHLLRNQYANRLAKANEVREKIEGYIEVLEEEL